MAHLLTDHEKTQWIPLQGLYQKIYIFAKIDVKVVNFQKTSLTEGRSLLICSNVMLQKDFQVDPHVF